MHGTYSQTCLMRSSKKTLENCHVTIWNARHIQSNLSYTIFQENIWKLSRHNMKCTAHTGKPVLCDLPRKHLKIVT
jgi:hypothetical protein